MTSNDGYDAAYQGIADLGVSLADGVLSVTLNRPDSLNSLTAPMLQTFAATLERAATDSRVRVVRIGGAGRGFSSGAGISLSLIHISEPTRLSLVSRMPSSA